MRLAPLFLLMLVASPAFAAPDAAPWDYDGGPGRSDCTQCHFDAEPFLQSDELRIEGLPTPIMPTKTYLFALHIEFDALVTAGFLITAEMNGAPAGEFQPADERTASNGAALRSTLVGARQAAKGAAQWTFRWTAPAHFDGPVTFYVAANASNDDASALGDQIFLSRFEADSAD